VTAREKKFMLSGSRRHRKSIMNPQQKFHFLSICPLLAVSLLSSCAAPGPQGIDSVRVLAGDESLQECTPAGTTHVSVADRLSQLQATEGAVQQALLDLARRSALQLGGNAVVARTGIDNGSQSFGIYHCP
jgi:hypothetical protein